MLDVGTPAPAFTALDQNGSEHSLGDYRGKWVVLYFYPEDDTPGCTKEACGFRDSLQPIKDKGAMVFGVSPDSMDSHAKFAEKFHLTFPLLADEEKTIINAYHAWGRKKSYGKEYDGIFRITYLIDPEGKIAKTYPKVTAQEHAAQILGDLTDMA
jgi:peroxiredoxin Q/BCP